MDALRLVTEADETILQIDAIVDDPFAAESEGKRQDVLSSVEQTKQLLVDADGSARNVSEKLSDPSVREVANQTVISITARQGMITQGMQLVETSEDAEQAAKECDAAWQLVLDADAQVREATKLAGRNESMLPKNIPWKRRKRFPRAWVSSRRFKQITQPLMFHR